MHACAGLFELLELVCECLCGGGIAYVWEGAGILPHRLRYCVFYGIYIWCLGEGLVLVGVGDYNIYSLNLVFVFSCLVSENISKRMCGCEFVSVLSVRMRICV